jgi:protein gp37
VGADSKIEWTHHTFNPWRGCSKISPGCAHCYAERMSHRNPQLLGEWGDDGVRAMASETYWKQPLSWDRAAQVAGERRRVFCASLADVFEDRPELVAPRVRLFHLINETPNLDWLLLTKRPENVLKFQGGNGVPRSWTENFPPNVWMGTSVEDQQRADERIPQLLRIPAPVRFLSIEPLIEAVDLEGDSLWCLDCPRCEDEGYHESDTNAWICHHCDSTQKSDEAGIDWVIVGGESGPGARPLHPDWVRSLRDQCQAAHVPFFFKQWGEFIHPHSRELHLSSARLIEFKGALLQRVGKAAAGRLLDGRTWDEFPEVAR